MERSLAIGESMKCIFCEEELTSDTKPEHVLLACFGGRKKTRGVDCSTHNVAFGSTIDDEAAEQARVIRNLLQLTSGTGNSPPGLRDILAGNETIDFDNEGNPSLSGMKPFTLHRRPDGRIDIEIRATSAEHVQKLIPHIAAAARISVDQVKELIRNSKAEIVTHRPGTVHHQLSFGSEGSLRSAVKSALVLWTLTVGNEEVRSPTYAEARDFVLRGGDFNARQMHLDSRPIPSTDKLEARFGSFFNLLYVASDADGRVIGHFTLYNMIGWQMVLAEQGGTPNRQTGLINNPLNPREWSDAIATKALIPFDWLNNPTYADAFQRSRERITDMIQQHTKQARDKEWDKIIRDTLNRNSVVEGHPIADSQVVEKISREIADRLTRHLFKLPYTQDLTQEQIAQMLGEE